MGRCIPATRLAWLLSEPLRAQGMERSTTKIADALRAVGLNPGFAERLPHQLSGGQRQRVAIARSLILKPDVVLLDEPTSALDVSVQAEILNLLADLREKMGLTYVLVSHDLAVVAHMCSRVAVMQSGKVLEELTAIDLRHGRATHDYTFELIASSKLDTAA